MQEPTQEMTQVPCLGCSRQINVPKTHVRAAQRDGRPFVVFCTRRCNLTYIAKKGVQQQEEQLRARHPDSL